MDKSQYPYETYPSVTKSNTNSLKPEPKMKKKKEISRCNCFGSKKRKAFFTGLATNLGICVVLFGYTLLGSVVFLAIEGGATVGSGSTNPHHILATTSLDLKKSLSNSNNNNNNNNNSSNSQEFKSRAEEVRAKTVENIWDITVSLNILYRDNWTKLAALEITRFQDELLRSINEDFKEYSMMERKMDGSRNFGEFEWTFAKSFLYSLTVLTTIGYGSLAPKTNLGKAATMGYAILGIPLTLLYLSSVGSVLSRIARGVFSRALCCCLCSNCGYCCYDEKRMAEKERRMKKKRQLMELKQQQLGLQEPFYVRSGVNYNTNGNNLNNLTNLTNLTNLSNLSNLNDLNASIFKENDNLSYLEDVESKVSIHGWSILAPILLCLASMFVYICLGTFILYKLENWTILDGFYFCFMSLTTIGFSNNFETSTTNDPKTIWFCSFYIMLGMALTAMCFNVVHDEIVHRLKHDNEKLLKKAIKSGCFNDDIDFNQRFNTNS